MIALLNVALRDRRCSVYTTDLRIRVQATGLATYPDVSVICGRLDLDPEDPKRHTAVNPSLLVEVLSTAHRKLVARLQRRSTVITDFQGAVLSPSTEDHDRGEKLEHYKQIPSLEEVLLVHHDERKITACRRTGPRWTVTERAEGAFPLAIGVELALADVYRDPLA